ncbi:O-methyltransferase [Tomitella fengzijianii]
MDSAAISAAETFAGDRMAARAAGAAAPVPDPAALADARERAADLGVGAVSDAVGAALSMLSRMVDARTAVEVGTGAGVSAQWLLSGMRHDGVLTTIDIEPEHQRTARTALSGAGVASARTRLIGGRGVEVLPRLADDAYEMMFVDCGGADHARYLSEAVRLLRPGGVVVMHGLSAAGNPGDAARRDPAAVDAREALRTAAENDLLLPSLLPLGGGLLCAARV